MFVEGMKEGLRGGWGGSTCRVLWGELPRLGTRLSTVKGPHLRCSLTFPTPSNVQTIGPPLLPPLDEIMIFWGALIEKTDRDLRTSDLTPQSGVGVGPAGLGCRSPHRVTGLRRSVWECTEATSTVGGPRLVPPFSSFLLLKPPSWPSAAGPSGSGGSPPDWFCGDHCAPVPTCVSDFAPESSLV